MKPTDEELNILNDVSFLKMKNVLTGKIIQYMSQIERALHHQIQQTDFDFPEGTFLKAGKISKGEQYKDLPYFILDYPRLFTQKEVFAFRSMLWWGHHYSTTLHLQGSFLWDNKKQIAKKIVEDKELYFCINKSPWEYHYNSDNYLLIKELDEEGIINQIEKNGFVKLSNYIPVTNWDDFSSFTVTSFARFLKCLKAI